MDTSLPAANVAERRQGPPQLAVSTVIFAVSNLGAHKVTGDAALQSAGQLCIPLVRRIREPYKNQWALPGGPLGYDESLATAAARNLAETTGLSSQYLEQLYAFGGLERSTEARQQALRTVSIVYWALVQDQKIADTDNVQWFPADKLTETAGHLAFDHQKIVDYALWRLRNKLSYAAIAYHFLGETFTLSQLHDVYQIVLGEKLDPANFRRQLRADPNIIATEEFLQGGQHRPPRLYRYRRETSNPYQENHEQYQ